ncbi:hypothetical protein GCM10027176_36820 [Actinoallomurus bryophytorum]|uniref:Uncharacterized protein n=1 Tax=Actinoallomurus bryophytorum TaxID=1490222 RepID=A0A543CIT9_9ACTN|nr:hypothetical protein [Actinoallomurus bryophytorum]TQL97008.1 hypothetical protein FB559_2578 [Actinoallomurus bryophytorum]
MSGVADVFLSLGGCDRTVVRRLVRVLRELDVTVFVDEDSIGFFEGIISGIENAFVRAG